MRRTYVFTFYSGPDWRRKHVTRKLRSDNEAAAFSLGLMLAGAVDVSCKVERRRKRRW